VKCAVAQRPAFSIVRKPASKKANPSSSNMEVLGTPNSHTHIDVLEARGDLLCMRCAP
jgi:hypothetical protein